MRSAVASLAGALTLLAVAHAQPAPSAPSPTAAAVPPSLLKLRATGVVTIAHRTDALPFSYLSADKQPIGYGIDVCNEIVRGLQRELRLPALKVDYVPVTAANRFQVLNAGQADVECGLTVNNIERRRDAEYSLPYYFAGPRILTRVNSGISEFHHLRGRRVVAAKGANAVPILQKRIETQQLMGTTLLLVDGNQQAFAALEKGDADAWVTTDNLLFAFRATAPNPTDYHVVGSALVVEPVAIVMRKGDVEFKAAVDRVLSGLMIDGVVGRLYDKWFLKPVPVPARNELRVVGIPMSALLRDQLRWPSDRAGDQ